MTRWNRRYLAAGAGVFGTVVALAFWIGFGGGHGPAKKAEPAPDPNQAVVTPAFPDKFARGYGDPAVQAITTPGAGLAGPSLAPSGAVSAAAAPAPAPQPQPADPAVQQARAQALAAQSASPFFSGNGQDGPQPSPTPTPVAFAQGLGTSLPGALEAPAADVQPANGQGGKRQFAANAKLDDDLQSSVREPISPWEVEAGTVIPAALLTTINSDLPGEIVAQVTEPVYDHVTGRTVLIPQGSRLIGQYDSQIAYGQERALIAWNRIVMPDGRSINIGSMEGADLSGASGLKDQVDGHFWQLARGVVLSTLFSVGAASAQDASSRSSGSLVLNSAGSGVANSAEQVGSQITSRDLGRQPTIRIRAGWPLRVLVNKDMILAPYP